MSSIQSLWSSLHRTRLSMYYYCLVFVVIQIVFQQVGRSQVQLKVAYITTNGGQYISNGSIPAVMLAVEKVNNASSDRYHLQLATASISVSTCSYTFCKCSYGWDSACMNYARIVWAVLFVCTYNTE